jgi:hypothetical protein
VAVLQDEEGAEQEGLQEDGMAVDTADGAHQDGGCARLASPAGRRGTAVAPATIRAPLRDRLPSWQVHAALQRAGTPTPVHFALPQGWCCGRLPNDGAPPTRAPPTAARQAAAVHGARQRVRHPQQGGWAAEAGHAGRCAPPPGASLAARPAGAQAQAHRCGRAGALAPCCAAKTYHSARCLIAGCLHAALSTACVVTSDRSWLHAHGQSKLPWRMRWGAVANWSWHVPCLCRR